MKTTNCHIRYAIILLLMTSCCFFVSHSFNIDNASTTYFHKTLCLPDQASALLQFKHEFAFHKPNYSYPYVLFYHHQWSKNRDNGYPKMKFWKAKKDCCYWDGVSCNMETGHVESLDLSHSWLHGPLHSNSSLFNLHQLQQLNLAFNNFSFSAIPSELGRLSRLTHLNLSSSFFCGHIPSGIFWLNKLISLDLSYNYHYDPFKGYSYLQRGDMVKGLVKNMTNIREILLNSVNLSSSLPESLANLSSLESLSLSECGLHGRFPNNIFLLPKMQVIDLSTNDIFTGFRPKFHNGSNLRSLILSSTDLSATLPDSIGNLKSLNVLDISFCDFSGTLPSSLWNLSKLTELYLSRNNFSGINQLLPSVGKLSKLTILDLAGLQLSGEVAFSLGNLARLEILDLSSNNFNGQISFSFPNLKKLRSLYLWDSGISGNIPSSLGDLTGLEELDLSMNNLSGQIPPSIGKLTRLEYLNLANNKLRGQVPPSFGNLIGLRSLYISNNSFSGKFPSSFGNLSQLTYLDISRNCFEGVIPWSLFTISSLEQMYMDDNQFSSPLNILNISSSKLARLDISGNKLNGEIPKSISKLRNLEGLYLGSNNLSGTVELDTFSSLRVLDLSYNNISKLSNGHGMASILLNLKNFSLSSCNITEFPEFLKSQHELANMDLSYNRIEGPIPKWFLSVGIDTLNALDLSHNFISGWEVAPSVLPWNELWYLNLHSNKLQGPLVVPPDSILYYLVSNNNLTGGIHPLFCKLKNLQFLDVSTNLLNGTITHCLGRLCIRTSSYHLNFMTLDLSNNRLQGKIPHSLCKCKQLEILNLGHNQIKDAFPSWLPELSELQVLVLRSNKFYGPVWHPHNVFGFRMLRIFDLSFNGFNGTLPPDFFKSWSSMIKISNQDNSSRPKYMGDDVSGGYYHASLTVMDKGVEMVMVKIITIFTSIDLSNNRFEGEIPKSLENLQSLLVFNLSNNSFAGPIPSSFANLRELESLDLSKNKLSGRIPPQFAKMTFLEYLDLSHNNLTGPIPQGGQMETFQASAFEGNFGLCGLPLPKKCDDTETPTSQQDQESDSGYDFGWRVVALGYGCGFLIGMVAGHFIISKRPNLFSKTFGVNIQRPR